MQHDAEWAVSESLAAAVDEASRAWSQGDVFEDFAAVRVADAMNPLTAAASRPDKRGPIAVKRTADLGVVLSQTCDVVRRCETRPTIYVAEVVRLQDNHLREASRGWQARYVPLPWVSDDQFADLDTQGSVEKSMLVDKRPMYLCPNDQARMKFAESLGRYWSRFAFPDDLHVTLGPLRDRIRAKAGQNSPQGRRVDDIYQIRARAHPDWAGEEIAVELVFVIDPDCLPDVAANEDGDARTDHLEELGTLEAQRLAELLDDQTRAAAERSVLWQRLVDAWADRAQPTGCIKEVTASAVPATEFSLEDQRDCPQLDFDHLSS